MKRIIIVFCLILSILLSGCSERENVVNDVAAEDLLAAYYTQDSVKNPLSHLETYVSSGSASKELNDSYRAAEMIRTLPVYGTYLEKTTLFACLFYRDNDLFAVCTLSVRDDINFVNVSELEAEMNSTSPKRATSNRGCYEIIKDCLQYCPDFEILGLIFQMKGYQAVRILGKAKDDPYLTFYLGEPKHFRLVDPFTTVEEGREAFAAYFAKKEATLARLPVYEWKKPNTNPFINTFQSACVLRLREEAKNPDLYWYIGGYYEEDAPEYYDNYIEIPLLDEKKKEGSCVLCLVYHHSDLLAELVLRKIDVSDREKDDLPMEVLYENAATRNPDGSYVPLQTTLYETVMEKEGGDGVRGVYFANGTYIPVR